jgi:hypothetical protein
MFSKTIPNSNLFQKRLKLMSLSTVWNENERFKLVFTKMLVFTAKTGSINLGTGVQTRLYISGKSHQKL